MKILASLAVLAAATIGSASATVITYNTAGSSFTTINGVAQAPGVITVTGSSGASTATITYGNIITSSFDDTTPGSVVSFGLFTDTFTPPDVSVTIPSFTLTVLLNSSGGNTTITGSSSGGTISQNSSNVFVNFAPLNFAIGNTAYTAPNAVGVPPSTSFGGQVSIQGFAVGTNTPEPGTMFLLGAGLIGVGFSARKKFLNRS